MSSTPTPIFLDHHATTPLDPEALREMMPFFTEDFGNPSSRHHAFGWKAEAAVELARMRIAHLIGCSERELIFTSGATESNNLAIQGALKASPLRSKHLITTTIEHASVLEPVRALERSGVAVTWIDPDSEGKIDPRDIELALRPETVLVSVQLANNEVGALQDIESIARVTHAKGAVLHSDASQAVGKIDVHLGRLKIDLLSFSAHKMYGPKGVGALFVRRRDPRVSLEPITFGGNQERGLRPGTLNVPAIVGFGKAAELAERRWREDQALTQALRERLWRGLKQIYPRAVLNGPEKERLPHNLNVQLPDQDGETILAALEGVALSSGSACTEADHKRSHVLMAMGLNDEEIQSSLRFGIGRTNTIEEIDRVLVQLKRILEENPVWKTSSP